MIDPIPRILILTSLLIDGYCGVRLGIFNLFAGIQAAKETLNPLLGQTPDEEFVKRIEEIVMSREEILGVHDFRVVIGLTNTNLIFDLLVPFKFFMTDELLMETVQARVWERFGENYFVVTKVDKTHVK